MNRNRITWILATLILTCWTAVSESGPEYHVQLVREGNSFSSAMLASDTQVNPAAQIAGGPVQESDGTNVFYLYHYGAKADQNRLQLSMRAASYSAYVVGMTYRLTARWTWDDVVFTCKDGRSQVDAALPLKVKGNTSGFFYTFTTAPSGGASLWLGAPQYFYSQGVWNSAGNNGWPNHTCLLSPPYTCTPSTPPTSEGVFAGITGLAIDETISFRMGEPTSLTVPTGVPVRVSPFFTLIIGVLNEDVSADFYNNDNGIFLRSYGPVFDLPEDCTCNSGQMGIVNNGFPSTPANRSTWGGLKSLYR